MIGMKVMNDKCLDSFPCIYIVSLKIGKNYARLCDRPDNIKCIREERQMKEKEFLKAYKGVRKAPVKPSVRIDSKKVYNRKNVTDECPYNSGGACGLQMECNDCE
jgi:hypothetical protein